MFLDILRYLTKWKSRRNLEGQVWQTAEVPENQSIVPVRIISSNGSFN
jgi:hypothetical protein